MELFTNDKYYVLRQNDRSLWCSRVSGKLEAFIGDFNQFFIQNLFNCSVW